MESFPPGGTDDASVDAPGRDAYWPVSRVTGRASAPLAPTVLYVPLWQPCELPPVGAAEESTWVVLCALGSLLNAVGDRLRSMGASVMTVWPGGLAKLGHESEAALLRRPELEGRQLRIVLSSSYFSAPHATDSSGLAHVCLQAARTVTAIAAERHAASTWLVTEASQIVTAGDEPHVAAAALWGVFKTALSEYPGRFGGSIDVPARQGTAADAESADVLAQLCKASVSDRVLAVRRGRVYRERLQILSGPAKRFQPRANAAYLVSGAFGSIGLILARLLLERDAGGLILQASRPPSSEQLQQIATWNAQGARIGVLIHELSTADGEAKIGAALAELGLPLGGIFHLAAVRADAPLAMLDHESWMAPIAAKHDSLRLLRRLARKAQVDTCVYFCSLGAMLGLAAQANRVAANAALQSIVQEDRRAGLPATCILWGPWAEALPANEQQKRRLLRYGLKLLDPRTVRDMFDAAVTADQALCIAAQVDWRQLAKSAPHLSWLEEVGGAAAPSNAAALETAASESPRAKLPPAAFLLSAPRSGSTLLRAMLAGHTQLFAPPELHLLQFDTMRQRSVALSESGLDEGLIGAYMELTGATAEAARQQVQQWVDDDLPVTDVYAALQRLAGSRLLVEKSPSYAMNADALADIERWFDAAKYIHLTRDPHGMIESFQRMRMYRMFGDGADTAHASGEFVWSTCNRNLLKLQAAIPADRWFTVSYEHLVQAPQSLMRELCEFLEVSFESGVLTPHAQRRKMDSIKPRGLPMGDPNFPRRHGIVPALAEVDPAWRVNHPLGPATQAVAGKLGYTKALTQGVPWMSGCRETSLDTGGRRASICQWGSPAGTPVLILHGWQDQGAAWAAVARNLADAGYRVLAPDLRQHGRDRDFVSHRPSIFDFLADTHALIHTQRLARVHVIGHSFGCLVAALLSVANPAQVASLALMEPMLPEDTPLESADVLRRHLTELARPLQMIRHDSLQAVARRLQYGYANLPGEALQALTSRIAEPDGGGYVCPMLERGGIRLAAALRDVERNRFLALLSKLEVPVLWLRGARSTQRRERDDRELEMALPAAQIGDIEAGHNLHIDAPAIVGTVLADFFAHALHDADAVVAEIRESPAELKT